MLRIVLVCRQFMRHVAPCYLQAGDHLLAKLRALLGFSHRPSLAPLFALGVPISQRVLPLRISDARTGFTELLSNPFLLEVRSRTIGVVTDAELAARGIHQE